MLEGVGGVSIFHESYFEHPCTVVTEHDVLYTDICGDGWRVKLRRCFHNWFLLSYTDERCRIFYTSSHALRLERARHYRRYRGRIHPLSKFSNLWSCIILTVAILNRVVFHQNTAMIFGKQSATLLALGALLEVMLLLDVVVNFKTGFTDQVARYAVLDSHEGFLHYSSTKLFLHVVSAIPLQAIMMLRYGLRECELCRANRFVCCLKLISIFGLYRVYDASEYWNRERSSFKKMYFFKFFRIFVLAFITMMQSLNFFDTVNILLMLYYKVMPDDSYFTMVMRVRFLLNDIPQIYFICVEFSIICKSLLLFGYGMYRHECFYDKLFGLLCQIISCMFVTWAMVECYTVVQTIKYTGDQSCLHKERIVNWMQCQQLSHKMKSKVKEYCDYNMTRMRTIEIQNELYRFLPSTLTTEIKLCANFSFIRRIPYFAEWPLGIVEQMVLKCKEEIYLERDIVAHVSDSSLLHKPFTQGEGLMVVSAGVLAVYSVNQVEVGHLIDGDYFGELSLVTDDEVRSSTVMTVTVCKILILNKKVFRKLMRRYPRLFFELRQTVRDNYKKEGQDADTDLASGNFPSAADTTSGPDSPGNQNSPGNSTSTPTTFREIKK